MQCCEELDYIIIPSNTRMVFSVYLCAEYYSKAINCFFQRREYDKIVLYASSVKLKMDYSSMICQLIFSNPRGVLDFGKGLIN